MITLPNCKMDTTAAPVGSCATQRASERLHNRYCSSTMPVHANRYGR